MSLRVFTCYNISYAYPALTCLVYLPHHRAGCRPWFHPYMSMRAFICTLYLRFTYLTTELEDDHNFTHTCLWGLLFVQYILGFSYLTTELEVDHDDGDLRHRDDQDDEHKEKETKQVVKLVLPYCLQSTQKELISDSCQMDQILPHPIHAFIKANCSSHKFHL